MTTFNGIILSSIEIGSIYSFNNSSIGQHIHDINLLSNKFKSIKDATASYIDDIEIPVGSVISTGNRWHTYKTNKQYNAVETSGFVETVRGSIYHSLKSISSFFSEDKQYELTIWNAKYAPTVLTTITVDNIDGTDLDPFEYPIGIPEEGYFKYTVTVYAEGPATQNTTYTFTIDGEEYETVITGTRIVSFMFPINWDKNYRFKVEHLTAIQKNNKKREQRRPMYPKMYKSSRVTVTLDSIELEDRLIHWFDFVQNRVVAIPLYQEAMFATLNIETGQTSITVEEDIEYYTFLSNCKFVLIVNHSEYIGEIKEISSVEESTNTISFVNTTVYEFDKTQCVIYPLYVAIVDSITYSPETNSVVNVQIEFEEFKQEV